jgi:hypothetical protein
LQRQSLASFADHRGHSPTRIIQQRTKAVHDLRGHGRTTYEADGSVANRTHYFAIVGLPLAQRAWLHRRGKVSIRISSRATSCAVPQVVRVKQPQPGAVPPVVSGQKWQGRSVTVWHVPEAGHQGGFLPHYLDKLVYPGNSANLLIIAGVVVCVAKLAFYGPNVDQPARPSLKCSESTCGARAMALYFPRHRFANLRRVLP